MSNNFSQKISNQEINLILKYMSSHIVENNYPSIKYIFKTKLYKITIYKNNTILIQGKSFENILKLIKIESPNKVLMEHKSNTMASKAHITIGSDEVGTGDLFGGIIVCACRIIDIQAINSLNIRDSKLIKDNEIKELFHLIKNYVEYEKYELLPNEYNEIYDKYKNLNILKTIGHYKTIRSLQTKSNDYALIDQYCSENKFNEYIKVLGFKKLENFILETKAESKYLEVACASIIARYFFVEQIKFLSKNINIKLPLGSSNINIKNIIKMIPKIEKINFLKLHFKNSN